MKKLRLFIRLCCLGALAVSAGPAVVAESSSPATPASAASRIVSPQLIVAPDREDWTYATGDPVTFTIRVLADGNPLRGARVSYRIGPERFESDPVDAEVPGTGLILAGGTLQQPGFLRCLVTLEHDGRTHRSLATAGFAPESIQPTQTEPEDFDAFWRDRLNELATVPVAAVKTLVPEACTPEVNVFQVRYQTWNHGGGGGDSLYFYGMLAEPAKPGRYPAVLQTPGASVRSYTADTDLASRGLIVLRIGIHGIPVDLAPSLYEDLRKGALNGYPVYNLDRRDRYYYLRVYLGCIRANDFLAAHEYWDGRNLVVVGSSQGGQLAIVTSALDTRVTGTVANYPAYCDVTGYLHGRAGGWPHMFSEPGHRSDAKIETSAYFDVVNFARRLRAPGSFGWGYNDLTCPPTSMYAAYNVVTAPKELWLQREMGHALTPEFSERHRRRIMEMVKTSP